MKVIINLTPHVVTVCDDNGAIIMEILPEAVSARSTVSREVAFTLNGVSVNRSVFGEVMNLPEPQDGTYFIVSRIVAEAANRTDLIIPDETVRDEDGKIIGCKSFAVIEKGEK